MKYLARKPFLSVAVGFSLCVLLANKAECVNLYLDVNGATTNSGVLNGGSYIWEDPIWSTSSVGTNVTTAWTEGNFPEFATGSDTVGASYTVTAGSSHHIVGALQRTSAATVTVAGADFTIDTAGGVSPGVGGAAGSGPQQGFFSSGNLTFTAKLTGSGGIQSQSGQIALNNSGNDYSGGTTINGGLINFNNANSFGSGLITVGTSGSALIAEATGITVPNNFSNSLVASLNLSATGSPFTTTFSGNWNLVGNMLSLGAGGGTVNTVILSGVLSGTGAFGRQSSTTHGTIRLTGANTYTGKSSFQSSVTSVSSLNSVTTPAQQTSSSLGKPSNAANGTLAFGATTFTGTLLYTGVGETTDRVIDLAGTTGGGIIQNDGTGALTFTGVNTASGVGAKTLTLQGAYAASANTISGAIVNSSSGATSLTKAGAGSWTLTGVNTFSGGIAVSGGTLTVGGAGQLNSGSYGGVISGGGTFTYNSAASQILSGNSTFTGTFNLNSGAIGVGNSGTFGAAGATVNINGGKFGNTAGTGRTIPSGVTLNINADFTVDDSFFISSANGQILFNGGTATLKNGNRTINVNQPNGQTVNLGIANVIGQDVAGRGIIKTGSGGIL